MADRRLQEGLDAALGPGAMPKAANIVGEFLGTALGSGAGSGKEVDPKALADAIAEAQYEVKQKEEAAQPDNQAAAVKLMVADPASAEYVKANKQRIRRVLVDMAKAKQL